MKSFDASMCACYAKKKKEKRKKLFFHGFSFFPFLKLQEGKVLAQIPYFSELFMVCRERVRCKCVVYTHSSCELWDFEGKFPNLVGRRKTRDLLKRDKNNNCWKEIFPKSFDVLALDGCWRLQSRWGLGGAHETRKVMAHARVVRASLCRIYCSTRKLKKITTTIKALKPPCDS